MKSLILCTQALALLLLAAPLGAQSHWKWAYPQPQGNTLRDIDVSFPTTAVAVGDGGTVIKTTDGGSTWTVLPLVPGAPDLNAVAAITPSTIVALCNGGVILRSANGGRWWAAQPSGTTSDLLDADFHGLSAGFAVGAAGTILRSDDGGLTWATQSSGTSATLFGVRMIDASTATVVGAGGTILKTIDAGASWLPQVSGTSADLHAVDFLGTNNGIAVGSNSTVRFTVDGGITWSPPATPVTASWPVAARAVMITPPFGETFIVGSFEGADDVAVMLSTVDGGSWWNVSYEASSAKLYGVGMFSSADGIAVGACGAIRRTSNGGYNWPKIGGGDQRFRVRGVDFLDRLRGVAVSAQTVTTVPSARSYATVDGGATWTVATISDMHQALDVAYAGAHAVYAVGRGFSWLDIGGTIWKSTDGGATWTEIFESQCSPGNPECVYLTAIDFAGPHAGVAVGWGIVRIDGDGVSYVPPPTTVGLYGVSVPSPQTAYAAGDSGVVVKGDLVGNTWTALATGTDVRLLDVCFTDDMTGTAVGAMGTILRTEDGGETWATQTSGTTLDLCGVSFINAADGLIATTGTMVLVTGDGGATWLPEETPIALVDVDFVDPAFAAAAGGFEGIVMHREGTVPVLFLDISARVSADAVELRWAVHSDETIRSFSVYRGAPGADDAGVPVGLAAPGERAFTDREVVPGERYQYTVVAHDENGDATRSRPVLVGVPSAGVALLQNRPNPFNPATHIRYTLPARMHVTLRVYDVTGRPVVTLVDEPRPGGGHEVSWDGRTGTGARAPSGVYFCELQTPGAVIVRRMVLLR